MPTLKINRVDYGYLEWLKHTIVRVEQVHRSYHKLINLMFETPFKVITPNDSNRGADGTALRDRYSDETGRGAMVLIGEECSILEMIIGVCLRLDDETVRGVEPWFWELMDNLQLSQFEDGPRSFGYDCIADVGLKIVDKDPDKCYPFDRQLLDSVENIKNILDVLNNREYTREGCGGLFPVRYNGLDQREVEIWYQMQYYLEENFIF